MGNGLKRARYDKKEHKFEKVGTEKCRFCGYHVVTDDFVWVCECCGAESCPDCAGRCGCEIEEK